MLANAISLLTVSVSVADLPKQLLRGVMAQAAVMVFPRRARDDLTVDPNIVVAKQRQRGVRNVVFCCRYLSEFVRNYRHADILHFLDKRIPYQLRCNRNTGQTLAKAGGL